jgi:hypothetical protein
MKKRMPLVLAFCQTPYQQTKFTTCKIQKFLLGTFCHFIEQIVRVGPNKKVMENYCLGSWDLPLQMMGSQECTTMAMPDQATSW